MKLDDCEKCENEQVCGFKALRVDPGEKAIFCILGCPVIEVTPIVSLDSINIEKCPFYKDVTEDTMTYKPKPLPTENLVLNDEQNALMEGVAAHLHDIWAAKYIAGGWKYGEKRDDYKKLHPCLVPYDKLPESEREYDRAAVMETIKAMIILKDIQEEKNIK